MLNLIDVYLGPEQLLMPPDSANPTGYWEHDEIVSLNDQILRRLGGSWDEPPTFPPGWENAPMIDDLKQRGRRLIQDSFANVGTWGWKDPRSCLTLPFWQQLLPDMRYVVCLRNPLDVAGSLEHRDRLSAEKSSQLWLTYVHSALKHSDRRSRLVVFYEDLIDDCLGELQRLADFLGKPERAKAVDVQEAVQEFMSKELQHHHTSIVQATASPGIPVRAKALYIAQRISVSFGRRESNGQEGVDHQIEKALDILSQYAIQASGQRNPLIEQLAQLEDQSADNRNTIRCLQGRLVEQNKELENIAVRLTESEHALKKVSTLLVDTETQLQRMRNSLGWRLLSRYGRIKHRYLLPIHRMLGQVFVKQTHTGPLPENQQHVVTIDKDPASSHMRHHFAEPKEPSVVAARNQSCCPDDSGPIESKSGLRSGCSSNSQ